MSATDWLHRRQPLTGRLLEYNWRTGRVRAQQLPPAAALENAKATLGERFKAMYAKAFAEFSRLFTGSHTP